MTTEERLKKLQSFSENAIKKSGSEKSKDSDESHDEMEGGEDEDGYGDEEKKEEKTGESSDLKLIFFFVVDFNHSQKGDQWILGECRLTLTQILENSTEVEAQAAFVKEQAKEQLQKDREENMQFPINIPQSWFISDKGKPEQWNGGQIEITMTQPMFKKDKKEIKFIGVLNSQKKLYLGFQIFEEYGEPVREMCAKEYIIPKTMAYITRNQQTKPYLMLLVRTMNVGITTTVFFGTCVLNDPNLYCKKQIVFNKDHFHAFTDCQILGLQDMKEAEDLEPLAIFEKDFNNTNLQACTLTLGDQEVYLKTSANQVKHSTETKRKSISQLHQGSFPIMFYNIGLQKIIIQSYTGQGKMLIYEIPDKEQLYSFITYNNLSDLGFTPKGMRIEGCSQFAFLTKNKKNSEIFVNMMLVDPYYDKPQISLFKSSSFFKGNPKPKYNDVVVKCIVCINNQQDVKMIQQYYTFLDTTNLREKVEDDYYDYDDYGDESSSSSSYGNESVSEDGDEEKRDEKLETVEMVLSPIGKIYYVVSYDGQCTIKEISPQLPDDKHVIVYELKSQKCLGFTNNGTVGEFYFIDEFKLITKLKRNNVTCKLDLQKELNIKKKDKVHFTTDLFQTLLIYDSSIINNSQIFYLYENVNKPLDAGILDMEELAEQKDVSEFGEDHNLKTFSKGPYKIQGSDQFVCVYNVTPDSLQPGHKSLTQNQKVYQLPASCQQTLLNDKLKKVQLSTFLDSGNIFVQLDYRYMVFDQNGNFKDQVEFTDIEEEKKMEKLEMLKGKVVKESVLPVAAPLAAIGGWGSMVNKTKKFDDAGNVIGEKKPVPLEISSYNRMQLRQMSPDNKYFLFEDRIKREFKVYTLNEKLQDKSLQKKADKLFKIKTDAIVVMKEEMTFELYYKFDLFQSLIFTSNPDELVSRKVKGRSSQIGSSDLSQGQKTQVSDEMYQDGIQKLDKNKIRLTMQNDGKVIVDTTNHNEDDDTDAKINVQWSVFERYFSPKTRKVESKIEDYQINVEFDPEAKRLTYQLIEKDIDQMRAETEAEKQTQVRLPESFQDWTLLEELTAELEDQEGRKQLCVNSYVIGDFLFLQCGYLIKYATITDSMKNSNYIDKWHMENLKDSQIRLHNTHEIINILSTCQPNVFQVIAKDNFDDILLIITWDFEKNKEVSMLQMEAEEGQKVEHYVTMGMNKKMNYFIQDSQIYDLEYNIPQQFVSKNSHKADNEKTCFTQQRKIYEDNSRYISVDPPNILNFPLIRKDLVFWMNIRDQDCSAETIRNNTQMLQFTSVFGDYSLLHFFADKLDVIKMIHHEYKECNEDGLLSQEEKNMPLIILHPDADGKTALDWAIQKQRPQSFELMLDMLSSLDNFGLSKMMLKSFPSLIKQGTPAIRNFLNLCLYRPQLIKESIIVYWPAGTDELVFASPTSLITIDSLHQTLIDKGKLNKNFLAQETERFKQKQDEFLAKGAAKGELKSQQLEFESQYETQTQRVQIEVVDFDWIFQEGNCKNMISILAQQGTAELYATESIRIFIKLMWKEYKPMIIKWIFIPYLLYLGTFMFLTSSGTGKFLENIGVENNEEDEKEFQLARQEVIWSTIFCTIYWCIFQYVELRQLCNDPMDYLKDYWNFIDTLSAVMNFCFIIMINIIIITDKAAFRTEAVRNIGSISVFLLWIKMFYWMRLFKIAAHYVLLIQATIRDIMSFTFLVILLHIAFANFFFIINNNTPENAYYKANHPDEDFHYVDVYIGKPIIDSFIAIYLLGLGEFDIDGTITKGLDVRIAWTMFFFATFLICVLFMNMLIAIMGDTFGNVLAQKDANSLREQLQLIEDFYWLINLDNKFSPHKYIIQVKPEMHMEKEEDVGETIDDFRNIVNIKQDKQRDFVFKRLDAVEKNMRGILKQQDQKLVKINYLVQKYATNLEKATPKPKVEVKKKTEDSDDGY